jgi:hypothetical protein
VRSLSKEQQRQYLSLHNHDPERDPERHKLSGIYRTNVLPCNTSEFGAVYFTICLINHSCDKNSHHSWQSARNRGTIHALRDIRAGEEITISYDDEDVSSVRRPFLKESFGFDCGCDVCSLLPSEVKESDARRLRMEQLRVTLSDPVKVSALPVRTHAYGSPPDRRIVL